MIDFTTDELADELIGGFHVAGPERLRRIGRLGLPQVVVPGCIDFTVHGRPEEVPTRLQGRPFYTHNPEFTLVRTLPDEMIELGRIFAARLADASGPMRWVPTQGLSIQRAGGPFWERPPTVFLAPFAPSAAGHFPSPYPVHIKRRIRDAVAYTRQMLRRTGRIPMAARCPLRPPRRRRRRAGADSSRKGSRSPPGLRPRPFV